MKKKLTKLAVTCRELAESYRKFNEEVYLSFSGVQRKGVVFCNLMLSLYITAVAVLLGFSINGKDAVLHGPVLFLLVYQALKFFLVRHGDLCISCSKERGKLSPKLFAVTSSIVFAVFILNLFAHYPGGISPDNIDQWNQVRDGNFHNWHPAIHTMMIWLVTRVLPVYSFFIGFQILAFSMVSGYMAATLAAWGVKKLWIAIFLVTIVATPSTRGILLYAWKDTALTILLLCLAVYMINIVLSDGKWLLRWYNVGALAIIGALTIVRHNGFFFTLPLGILIIVCYGKVTRNAIFAVALSVLMVLSITRVLYPLVGVTHSQTQVHVESVGLPMTILSGVMARYPERLDEQTRKFLSGMATDEEWRATFVRGNYNSVKWAFGTSRFLAEIPPQELLLMTLRTIRNAPTISLMEVIALTRMVWNPLDWHYNVGRDVEPRATGIVYSEHEIELLQPIINISRIMYGLINIAIGLLIPGYILTSIGLHMLLLLLAGVYSVNRNLGAKALVLFIPSVAYNLGTMLLLSGPDYRFFHFNTVITLPLIVALLARNVGSTKQNDHEC